MTTTMFTATILADIVIMIIIVVAIVYHCQSQPYQSLLPDDGSGKLQIIDQLLPLLKARVLSSDPLALSSYVTFTAYLQTHIRTHAHTLMHIRLRIHTHIHTRIIYRQIHIITTSHNDTNTHTHTHAHL